MGRLLAGMHALIPDWIVAGKVLTVLGAAVGFAGTYAFARRLAGSLQLPGAALFPAAMVLLVAFNPFTCYWIFSGMEAFAAAGLACFAVLEATSEAPSTGTFLTACLLAGIAPLVRPEMIFLTVLLALPLLAQWLRLPKSPAKLANLVVGAVLLCGPLALWSLYSLHAFGHLLPNTNAAKRAGTRRLRPRPPAVDLLLRIPADRLRPSAQEFSGWPCGSPPSASPCKAQLPPRSALRRRSASRSLPLSAWIFLLWALINTAFYIVNHTYVQTRYILVTAPALTVVIMAAAFTASRHAGRVVYALALLYAAIVSVVVARPFIRNKGINCQAVNDLAVFIRDRVPPTAPVAAYGIGEIAFVSQHPIVDTGGITRPEAIPYLNAPFEDMVRWARSQGAQYFVIGQPAPDAVLVFNEPLRKIGWTFHTSVYENFYPLQLWSLAPGTAAIPPAGTTPSRPPLTRINLWTPCYESLIPISTMPCCGRWNTSACAENAPHSVHASSPRPPATASTPTASTAFPASPRWSANGCIDVNAEPTRVCRRRSNRALGRASRPRQRERLRRDGPCHRARAPVRHWAA